MKKVVMFYEGRLFPNCGGTARVVEDMARYFRARPDVWLKLVVLDGRMTEEDLEKCRAISHEFVRLAPAVRFSPTGILNGLVHRFGADVHAAYFRARALRSEMSALCADADLVLVNFAVWYSILPREVRRKKAIVITHDVLFQRRTSFSGTRGFWRRVANVWGRRLEVAVLKSFRTIAVFAEYEKNLLVRAGIDPGQVVCMGLPIVCAKSVGTVQKAYDFLIVGANCLQNEEAVAVFFARVVPLLGARPVSLAVVGTVGESSVWKSLSVPPNVSVARLGRVDDLARVCQSARIGVSTPPHGSGIKVKTVECIEYGLPMIVTDCGAEGVPVTEKGAVNIDRVSSDVCAQRIAAWLDDPASAAEDGRQQAEKVREAFSPSRLENLLPQVW